MYVYSMYACIFYICMYIYSCHEILNKEINNSENTQIESNWKYKHIQLCKSISVTSLTSPIVTMVTKVSVLSNLRISR